VSRRKRLVLAVAVAGGGAALCLALDHHWLTKQSHVAPGDGPFDSAAGDLLLVAIPFYVLAGLIACTRIRAVAAAVGGAAIAALTLFEYRWATTTESSTAALAFVGAIELGVPLAIAAWGLDGLAARIGTSART
jgi:hypothetical protein